MLRLSLIAAVLLAPSLAAADAADDDPIQLGGWFGPRIFSDKSTLGYINNEVVHPMLDNSIELGARVARRFMSPWLYPEAELGFSPTHSTAVAATSTHGAADAATVLWFEPRVQLRFELKPGHRVQPFVFVGGGAPIAISSARKTFNSGVVGDGFVGGGVRFDTDKGFTLRVDARLAVLPGVDPMTGDNTITTELELGLGFELPIGAKPRPPVEVATGPVADADGDGIPDNVDKCPDRPEDKDGFEDADGCPDIDNDGDHVLDIADRCPMQPETFNGFDDDDGCPDQLPADVDSLRGTIEGLLYAEGETAVHDSAQPALQRIAKILLARPSVRIMVVGHTDDREAKQFAPPQVEGQPPPDFDSLATELAHGRAESVRQALVAAGAPANRIVIDGVGAEDPVADNATAKGRLANRRVEVKLFVPPHN